MARNVHARWELVVHWATGPERRHFMEDASPKGDPERIASRYYKTAAEYVGLARGTSSPSLRAHFARIAEEYMVRADGEMRVAERRQVGAQ
jgi:hypothetical protein